MFILCENTDLWFLQTFAILARNRQNLFWRNGDFITLGYPCFVSHRPLSRESGSVGRSGKKKKKKKKENETEKERKENKESS